MFNFFNKRTFGAVRSPLWRGIRNAAIAEHPFCSVCGTTKKLEAHHVIPVHIDQSKELIKENLIILCRDHHYFFGHFNNWSLFNPTVVQDSKTWNTKLTQHEIHQNKAEF